MAAIHGRKAGKRIAEALGLEPSKIKRISLDFDCMHAATVTVEMFVQHDNDELSLILREFDLVERQADEAAA